MGSRYDLVHVRMLVAAMLPGDCKVVVHNLAQLLKPGGFLQWEECDFLSSEGLGSSSSCEPDTLRRMGEAFHAALGERFEHGWNTLPDHTPEAGLMSVVTDVASSDRFKEMRRKFGMCMMILIFNWARQGVERGAPTSMFGNDLDKLEKKFEDEIKSGCYFKFNIHVACARKVVK
ncbi:hypothetical protein F5Y11DRAFT_100489 [Daldinia sp. FL1419]|nr:hypothetical protein F5Y11DRAFT_100489 [Daldinia sp. FL1419]